MEAAERQRTSADVVLQWVPQTSTPATRGAGSAGNTSQGAALGTCSSHSTDWILDELEEEGVVLEAVFQNPGADKFQFCCPLHDASKKRARGGSAVMWSGGHGQCASTRCNATWKTLREFVALYRARGQAPAATPLAPIVRLSTVKPEATEWIWEGRVPLGKLVLHDGWPGGGKSLTTLDLAARVSTHTPMPDGSPGVSGGVVLVCCEDGVADTVVPRLQEAGADLDRVAVLDLRAPDGTPRLPSIPEDLPEIQQAIEAVEARLVIVDPLVAFLSDRSDSYKDHHVRRALGPLAQLAEDENVAVLAVRHLKKREEGPAIARGGGSIGIIGAARVGLLANRDPVDPSRFVLAVSKCNLGPIADSMAYRITTGPGGAPRIEWLGRSSHSADDVLRSRTGRASPALEEAKDFLRRVLPAAPEEVHAEAKAAGIAGQTLRRAKEALGVISVRVYEPGQRGIAEWAWEFPAPPSSSPAIEDLDPGPADELPDPRTADLDPSASAVQEEA